MLSLILLIAAFVMFVLATIAVPSPPRFQWLPAGLSFWVLSLLLAGARL